jgi:hypothetical protein
MTTSILATQPTRGAACRIEAARRRATDARHRANNRPTPENLNRAAELEAGLERMESEARA